MQKIVNSQSCMCLDSLLDYPLVTQVILLLCVSELSLTITNSWDTQLIREKAIIILTHGFGGFSVWSGRPIVGTGQDIMLKACVIVA